MIPFATQFSIFSDLDHDQLYKEKKGNEKIVEMQAPASKVHLVLLSPWPLTSDLTLKTFSGIHMMITREVSLKCPPLSAPIMLMDR